MFNIKQTIAHLQLTNQKAYYLAFLRVALSIWILKELLFRWRALELVYSNHSLFNLTSGNGIYLFHLDPLWFKQYYMLVVYGCIMLLLLNILGIGRNMVSFLLFISLALLQNMNDTFGNGGDWMALILVFYLSFADTFAHFTLFKQKPRSASKQQLRNLLSNLAAYSIMINLCLVYFMAGLYKAQDPYWLKGTGIYYFLNDERYSILAANKQITTSAVLPYIVNYGTLLFEIAFPFLVYFRRTRAIALILGVLMHLGIYFFLMIYGMSLIFIIQYGLFFSNEEIVSTVEKVKGMLKWKEKTVAWSKQD